MSSVESVGILGTGAALPEEVRTNEWWPASFREHFAERAKRDLTTPEVFLSRARSPAQRIQLEQMVETYHDPFRGSRERRVAAAGARASELEVAAGKQALERAGVDPREVDLIICSSCPTDNYFPTNAGYIQVGVGASRASCIHIDTACSSFLSSLSLAEAMIRAGQCRYVLVVTSSLFSRVTDYADPISVNCGDGAGAVVIGPVARGEGFLSHAARTLGELNDGVCVAPANDKPWYEGSGPLYFSSHDLEAGRRIVMSAAEFAAEMVEVATRKAGVEKSEMTRFYSHQPTIYFNRACRLASGLGHCETTDSFTRFGSIGAANIPVNLFLAQESGQLKQGDLVMLYACGGGLHLTASVLRWAANPRTSWPEKSPASS